MMRKCHTTTAILLPSNNTLSKVCVTVHYPTLPTMDNENASMILSSHRHNVAHCPHDIPPFFDCCTYLHKELQHKRPKLDRLDVRPKDPEWNKGTNKHTRYCNGQFPSKIGRVTSYVYHITCINMHDWDVQDDLYTYRVLCRRQSLHVSYVCH